MASQLPVELYRDIVGKADRHTLLVLVTVSRVLQEEAERLLWHKATFYSAKQVIHVCTILLATPRRAPLVRCIDMHLVVEDNTSLWPVSLRDALKSVFPILENLSELSMPRTRSVNDEWSRCGDIYEGCTFKLHALRCSFSFDDSFVNFLTNQPSITHFHLDHHSGPLFHSLDPTTLPRLSTLCLHLFSYFRDGDTARAVSRRPITHFRTTGQRDLLSLFKGLASSCGPLRGLSIKIGDLGTLKAIVEFLPQLEDIGDIFWGPLTYLEHERYFYSDFLPALGNLQSLTFHAHKISDLSNRPSPSKMHTLCPSLRQVSLRSTSSSPGMMYGREGSSNTWVLQPDVEDGTIRDLFLESARRYDPNFTPGCWQTAMH